MLIITHAMLILTIRSKKKKETSQVNNTIRVSRYRVNFLTYLYMKVTYFICILDYISIIVSVKDKSPFKSVIF